MSSAPPAAVAGEESAGGVDRAMRTFRLGALADLLVMALKEQIRTDARVELFGNFRLDCLLRLAIYHTVVLVLLPPLDSHDHVRAVGGNSSHGRDTAKEQDAVGAGISDTWELLEYLALNREIGIEPEQLLAASPANLASALRPGGMVPELRAMRLKEIAARVKDEFGSDLRAALVGPIAQVRIANP